MSDKIIFLDIDGCMTSKIDGTSYLCENPSNYGISEDKKKLLLNIIEKTGAKVIISSNWRRFDDCGTWMHHGKAFTNPIPKLRDALGDNYIGVLTTERHLTKSEALTLWFEDNNIKYDDIKFVVIDDDYDEGFSSDYNFNNYYVHCDYNTGLTEEQSEYIIKLLNRE